MIFKKFNSVDELISFIAKNFKYISYNEDQTCFVINAKKMKHEIDIEISHLTKLFALNKNIIKEISSVYLESINLEYYDKCMVNYCEQILDRKKKNKDTCWGKNASKYISLGYYEKQIKTLPEIKNFLEKINSNTSNWILNILDKKLIENKFHIVNGWLLYNVKYRSDNYNFINSMKNNFNYYLNDILDYKKDRVLDVVKSIKKNGWDENLAWHQSGVVLFKSNLTGKVSCLTGRHRICAAVYLARKGIINKKQKFFFPILTGNFDYIRTSNRPTYINCQCR